MAACLTFIGICWLIGQLIKDGTTKQYPKGQNLTQAFLDSRSGVSKKEIDLRLSRGYYLDKRNK